MANPPAWHPDPTGRHEHRYWDGEQWTDHVADGGQSSTDPLDGGPGESGAGATPSGEPEPSRTAPMESQPTAASPPSYGASPPGGSPSGGGSTFPSAGPVPAGQSASSGTNGMAVAALIIGILSLLISIFPFIGLIGTLGGIAALVLGFVGRKKAKTTSAGGGMAITGIITGILAIIVSLLVTIGVALFFQNVGGDFVDEFNSLEQCIQETGDEDECARQLEEDLFQDLFDQQ